MSQPPTDSAGAQRAAMGAEAGDPSAGQLALPGHSTAAVSSPDLCGSSAAAASSSAAASTLSPPRPSLMRLAVVERQLIMQALDLTSLVRLSSTCSQLRAEALHREAGKLIPEPDEESALGRLCSIGGSPPAHASPLFRMFAPVRLGFGTCLKSLSQVHSLTDEAATFSRITQFSCSDGPWWTDDLKLRLLSLPCMQTVRRVILRHSPPWFGSPLVQTALFSLPQLTSLYTLVGPTTKLQPSAVALASELSTLDVYLEREHAASVRSLRALRLAPALTSLLIDCYRPARIEPVLAVLVWCLPPTLTDLSLDSLDIPRDLPRPLAKALFARTPLLQSVHINGSIETILRGLLDAGLRALPRLHRVHFGEVAPDDFSFDQDPDPVPPLLRRFLHRFLRVTVRFELLDGLWEPDQLIALQRTVGWPRVRIDSDERPSGESPSPHASDDDEGSGEEDWEERDSEDQQIGAPPSPHDSDDVSGSDVEDLADPGLDSDERGN